MNTNKIIKSLEVRVRNLTQERDKLRNLEDDIKEYRYRADQAIEDIESAIDILSEVL